jgi:predicted deacylase
MRFELTCPDIGKWKQGNTGVEGVWSFDSGKPGRHVMVSSLVHGNELCGAWALKGMLEAELRPEIGKLTLVFANLRAFERFDPTNHDASRFVDEDMNRQWMPERIAQATTQERQRVAQLEPFVKQADWLLDLHSMHEVAQPLLLTGIHPRNQLLAKELGNLVHVVVDAGHKDGTRMRDFGHFGAPDEQAPHTRSLLIECGFHGDPKSKAVAQDMVARFLAASGCLSDGRVEHLLPGWRLPSSNQQWALDVAGAVVAKSANFRFTEEFKGLEMIAKAGTVIGDNDGEPVVTPYDECVLVMPSVRQARAGVTVVRFAKRRPL